MPPALAKVLFRFFCLQVPFSDSLRSEMEEINTVLCGRGEKVVAFAHIQLDTKKFPHGFVFSAEPEPNFPTKVCLCRGRRCFTRCCRV